MPTKKAGRPPTLGDDAGPIVSFRIPLSIVKALDAYADSLSAPGIRVSRATAARSAVVRIVEEFERAEKGKEVQSG